MSHSHTHTYAQASPNSSLPRRAPHARLDRDPVPREESERKGRKRFPCGACLHRSKSLRTSARASTYSTAQVGVAAVILYMIYLQPLHTYARCDSSQSQFLGMAALAPAPALASLPIAPYDIFSGPSIHPVLFFSPGIKMLAS